MGRLKVVLEESIMQKGKPASAGSKMLENFISPIDATVVTRLKAAGAEIVGRVGMDEFGVKGLFLNSEFVVRNSELHMEVVSAVADWIAYIALCNDYTGSVCRAAAESGLYYIRPTYGIVSRYGLIPAVTSMDQIGIVCKELALGFDALAVIAADDHKDGAMLEDAERPNGKWKMENGKSGESGDNSEFGIRNCILVLFQRLRKGLLMLRYVMTIRGLFVLRLPRVDCTISDRHMAQFPDTG